MADLTITAASVVVVANAATKSDQGVAGETIAAGKAVYKAASGKWMLADNDSATAEAKTALGIALNGAALDQPLTIHKMGKLTIGATLTAGSRYYLSSTAGGIMPEADLASGDYVCLLGLASSASVLDVNIQTPDVTL
jgi:hypothetical protein